MRDISKEDLAKLQKLVDEDVLDDLVDYSTKDYYTIEKAFRIKAENDAIMKEIEEIDLELMAIEREEAAKEKQESSEEEGE